MNTTRQRRTNARAAPGIGTTKPTPEGWAIFDSLPPQLRRVLWEQPLPINPAHVAAMIEDGHDDANDYAAFQIRNAARLEIDSFGAAHQRQHGAPLPHLAADATVQPYESPQRRQRGRIS